MTLVQHYAHTDDMHCHLLGTHVSNTANTKRMVKNRAMEAPAAMTSHGGRDMEDRLRLRLCPMEAGERGGERREGRGGR